MSQRKREGKLESARAIQPLTLVEVCRLLTPFDSEKSIVIAVSGGPDSTALLWLASQWHAAQPTRPSILALTVHHRLRKGSAPEANAGQHMAPGHDIRH